MSNQVKQAYEAPVMQEHGTIAGLTQIATLSGSPTTAISTTAANLEL